LIQPAANDLIARQQRPGRHGVSFGLLQTAIPLSTLLAGLAVPAIGIPLGWRWAFLLGAVAALPFMLLSLQQSRGVRCDRPTVVGGDVRPARAWRLFLLAAAGGLAAAPANAAGAFYVESLVAKGIGVGQAGVWLMAGSGCGVAGRLLWGWLLDRRQGSPLRMMTLLLLVGAVGFALLGAAGTIPLLVVSTGLAFAAGWGWKGLYNLAVVQRSPGWASSALGITQAGVFVGSVLGPLGFGVALGKASFAVAWSLCALSMFAATAIIWVEGRMSVPFGRKDRVGSASRLERGSVVSPLLE
jgi:predicted MFS family arabinose efflux permease